jgi:uncharacterized protein YvpB
MVTDDEVEKRWNEMFLRTFLFSCTLLLVFLLYTDKTDAKTIINAPYIRQMPELPRGCEVTSLAMLLQHAGVKVDKLTLAKQVKKVPFKQNGLYGNPFEGFVGDMYTLKKSGYGVYYPPVYELAQKYIQDRAVNLSGQDIKMVYQFINNGVPVWVIVNTRFQKLPSSEFRIWNTNRGKLAITYREHSVLVTGYDNQYIYVNDPLYSRKNRVVSRKNFEAAWVQMGKQAISYLPKPNWVKELKAGQIGKLTILKPIQLRRKNEAGQLEFVRTLRPYEAYRVYSYSQADGMYQVGNNLYVKHVQGYVKYETPPKELLKAKTN